MSYFLTVALISGGTTSIPQFGAVWRRGGRGITLSMNPRKLVRARHLLAFKVVAGRKLVLTGRASLKKQSTKDGITAAHLAIE